MVSFVCDECQGTLKKAKVAAHSWSCSSRSFSCIDCGVAFTAQSVAAHTQCISEAEKHHGRLYRAPKSPAAPAAPPAAEQRQDPEPSEERCRKRRRDEEAKVGAEGNGVDVRSAAALSGALDAALNDCGADGASWKALRRRVGAAGGVALHGAALNEALWAALRKRRRTLRFALTAAQHSAAQSE